VLDAVDMLRDLETGEKPLLGRKVAVYGGGNTAMDAARTAKRLGASEAVVVYRRTQDRAPAHESELAEAEDEGVLFKWLTTIKQVDAGKLVVERMELDDSGFPQPTGELDELDADSLVLALGQETDLSLLDGVPGLVVDDGVVAVGPDLMTGCPGIFAGGDMVPYERSVTVAIGHGKRAARHIDAWLSGAAPEPVARPALATFDTLNTWYYADAPRSHRAVLDRTRRDTTYDEGVLRHEAYTAPMEAPRCTSFGNCYGVCPDNAVIKLGRPGEDYLIDLDYCKGCGICEDVCPVRNAIEMEEVLV